MTIFVIDYLSYKAHQNFNKIHINALLQLGHSLHLIGKNGQFDNIQINENVKVSSIPNCFYKNLPFPQITARINFIICLLWIRFKYRIKDYDLSLILTYEPLSVFAFKSKKPVVIITHDGHYLDNKVKLRVLQLTPKHYINICLNRGMERHVKDLLPDRKVFFVPHGICQPSTELSKPSFLNQTEKYLFCPINMKYKKEYVEEIFKNPLLHKYLKDNNVVLYIKEQLIGKSPSNCIITINNNLAKSEYDYMIQNAYAVILPYDRDYMYRCSGILFECVARDVLVLTTKLAAMEEYKDAINIKMFDNVQELINSLEYFEHNSKIIVNKNQFAPLPYWQNVFDFLRS